MPIFERRKVNGIKKGYPEVTLNIIRLLVKD